MLAANRLSMDHTTVARRVASLETAIGAQLIDRSPRGTTLTEDGIALLQHAEKIEAEFLALSVRIGSDTNQLSGVVRVATPDAFASFFLANYIDRFVRTHPDMRLELVSDVRSVSLSKREADIVVGFVLPPRGRLVTSKLADGYLGLYASRAFVEKNGPFDCISSLQRQPFVGYVDDLAAPLESNCIDEFLRDGRVVFRSDSLASQLNAVASGAGFGLLPSFLAADDPRVVSVLSQAIRVRQAYWLSFLSDYQSVPRIRAVVTFLREIVGDCREYFSKCQNFSSTKAGSTDFQLRQDFD